MNPCGRRRRPDARSESRRSRLESRRLPSPFLTAAAVCLCLSGAGCRLRPAVAPLSQSFEAKGVRIHYLVQGTGEPVVLIHGLYASAAANWQLPGTLAELAGTHRVIALDLPGHGLSDKPGNAAAYGLQMVEDVVLLLDRLKVRSAHVIGYSLGGMIALKLIAIHPDRVLSGVLGGMGWMQEGSATQRMWRRPFLRSLGPVPGACVASIADLALTREELLAIRVPVEVLIGDHDRVYDLYVLPLRTARPDWPVLRIRNSGHLDLFPRDQFRQELVRWLDRPARRDREFPMSR